MRGRLVASAFAVAIGAPAGVARAQSPPPPAPAPAPVAAAASAEADLSHKGQLQGSVRVALGMRAIATYDSMVYCGDADPQAQYGFAPVCTGRAPMSLDLELGYGVARRVDLIAELRLGLERDFGAAPGDDGPRLFHLSPGARFFFSDGRFKLFTTAQVIFDFAGYEDARNASRGKDVGIRNLSGLWVDVSRTLGVYAFVGETASVARWLRFELEGGLGLSGRYF
ncbi:MAG TPA: hypothetical protein VNO30_50130 [Kofleriaceae bacterium]|nr:hypothetical protein [Kofleriaceae bacterium]